MANVKDAKRAYLVLEDGTVFKGYSMGAVGTTFGEVVFNTCTASYQALLSDPTYYGQIVAQTYPLVGNRGVGEDTASQIMASGYIAREWCDTPTDLRGVTIDAYLKNRNIVGLCGIDTRRLTRILRDKGYFNGAITDTLDNMDELIQQIKAYSIAGALKAVDTKAPFTLKADHEQYRMAVLNFGCSPEILAPFVQKGATLTFRSAFTSPDEILADQPDGIILSDGPGDPDEDESVIETIRTLTKSGIPIFALGLGHQMLALAAGGRIDKMERGHRGSNQPVRNLEDGRIMITTQNHGYTVAQNSMPPDMAKTNMVNVNDGTIEGLKYSGFAGLSVQFEPSDGSGFQDSAWIFDQFVQMMKGE